MGPIDPELEALPKPRRPWRRTTLAVMAISAAMSVYVAGSLAPLVAYAGATSEPRDLGDLTGVQPGAVAAGTWVHGRGVLSDRAVEYRRPLERDRFRLVQVDGNSRVWVELRIPGDLESTRYVAPSSFVGRFTPLARAGLRHGEVAEAARSALGTAPSGDAWVLVDGEAPATTRWAAGLVVLFAAFAAFNAWGIARLLRPTPVEPAA